MPLYNNEALLSEVVGQPEGSKLEYKSTLTPPSITARIIAAFANSEGGIIVFGVQDDLTLKGISEDAPAESMVAAVISRLNPRPSIRYQFVQFQNKTLFIIEVEKSEEPVLVEGDKIYIRRGASVQKHSSNEAVEIISARKFEELAKTVDRIKSGKENVTDSKHKFLSQYLDLYSIVDHVLGIITSLGFDKPSGYSNGRTLMRLLFSSLIDTFEVYLADLLLEIYYAEPNTLKSDAQVTIKNVLECQNMAGIIELIATEKINKLKKGSGEGFKKSFKSATNLDVFEGDQMQSVEEFYQIRHLYIHKNGIVDTAYLAKNRNSDFQTGQEHTISLKDLCVASNILLDIVDRLDTDSSVKYRLSLS